MATYILSVTICAIVVSFISVAAPRNGGINKFVSFISSLVISIVIVSPVTRQMELDIFLDIPSVESEDKEDYNKIAAESLSKSIAKTLEVEHGVKVNKITVIMGEGEGFVVDSINVVVERTILDVGKISHEVGNLYNCKIEIIIGDSG